MRVTGDEPRGLFAKTIETIIINNTKNGEALRLTLNPHSLLGNATLTVEIQPIGDKKWHKIRLPNKLEEKTNDKI